MPELTKLPPGLVERAVPGRRRDVARCYGIAALLLREGEAIPDDLTWWLSARLSMLAAEILDKKRPNLEVALWIAEPGKVGRKEKTGPVTDEFIHEQCRLEKAQRGGQAGEIDERVAAFITAGGWPASAASVKAARLRYTRQRPPAKKLRE
jgi:hypothetical protein